MSTAAAVGLSVAGSLAGNILSYKAAGTAAEKTEAATAAAIAEQRRQYDTNIQLMKPWRTVGAGALGLLQHYLGIGGQGGSAAPLWQQPAQEGQQQFSLARLGRTGRMLALEDMVRGEVPGYEGAYDYNPPDPSAAVGGGGASGVASGAPAGTYGSLLRTFGMNDFLADPGYKDRIKKAEEALRRLGNAGGSRFSGKTIKDTLKYAGGLADQTYNDAFNRYRLGQGDIYSRLMGAAGYGLQGNEQLISSGTNISNNIASNMIGGGTAAASLRQSGSQAVAGGLANAGNAYMNYLILRDLAKT